MGIWDKTKAAFKGDQRLPHEKERDRVAALRSRKQTGRWACDRCGVQWEDPERAPDQWWTHRADEGPHVCPGCYSYAYTSPF
jgi:rubrerythrin